MSTYVDNAINPKTGKLQSALFIDDFYGHHHYGVGFKKDNTEARLEDSINREEYVIYRIEEIKIDLINNNGGKDI